MKLLRLELDAVRNISPECLRTFQALVADCCFMYCETSFVVEPADPPTDVENLASLIDFLKKSPLPIKELPCD